jgi:FSR family fosmidomycin resistance protein-like MFS transporter
MGQEFLPGRLGVSAGVTIGLSIGLGGAGAPLLGLLADAHGLRATFELIAVLPVLALVLAFVLPRTSPDASPARYRGEPAESARAA